MKEKKKSKYSAIIQKELDRRLGKKTIKEKVERENIIYARVSTKEQKKKFGIPSQLSLLEKYAEKNKFEVKKENIFTEDETAMELGRSIFTELIKRFQGGGKYRIFVDEGSRLTREPEEGVLLDRMVKDGTLEIHFASENFVYDEFATSHDIFIRRINTIISNFFVSLQTEKSIKGTLSKLEAGQFPGYPPVAYYPNPITGKIEKDPERWDKVKKLWRLAKTGKYTYSDLTQIMRDEGLTVRVQKKKMREIKQPELVRRRSIERILTNPFYSGKFSWYERLWSNRGINNDIEPTYPIMISWQDFEEAREAIAGHGVKRGKKVRTHEWQYKDVILFHYCGCSLIGFEKKGIIYYRCTEGKLTVDPDWYRKKFPELGKREVVKNGKKQVKYICPQNNPTIRGYGDASWKEKEIDEIIERTLKELYFDENVFKWMREKIGEDAEIKYEEIQTEIQGLKTRKGQIESNLKDLVLSKKNYTDEIELDIYRKELENLKEQLLKIDNRIAELEEDRQENMEQAIDSLELAYSFKNKYLASDKQSRKEMLKIMFRTVWAGDGSRMKLGDTGIVVASEKDGKYNHLKSLGFVWREPFRTLFDIKLIQEISEREADNPKNGQWHAYLVKIRTHLSKIQALRVSFS